jgi:hypothetical protein
MLSEGADLEAKTEQGFTPLSYAVGLNHPDNCRALLEAGAEVDSVDNWKRTNLNVAAGQGLADVAAILLEFNANAGKAGTVTFLQEQTRLGFAMDDDGQRVIRVVDPYGIGDIVPLLEFTIEFSTNLSDWEIVESVDTDDGIGDMAFAPDTRSPARFFRVSVAELEE